MDPTSFSWIRIIESLGVGLGFAVVFMGFMIPFMKFIINKLTSGSMDSVKRCSDALCNIADALGKPVYQHREKSNVDKPEN